MHQLAPIRIDVEVDGLRFLDTFVVDVEQASRIITPGGIQFEDFFASILCRDFNLLSSVFKQQISNSIQAQIEDFLRYNTTIPGPSLSLLIKLDIIADGVHLVDQFEWQLNPPVEIDSFSPELFADNFVKEFALSLEFKSSISHCIREQCHYARKVLISQGYDGIQNTQIPYELLGVISKPNRLIELRPSLEWELYSPKISPLEENADTAPQPSIQERESRRLRRQLKSKTTSPYGSSLGILGVDSSWPSSFKVIRTPYPPTLEPPRHS